MNLNIRADNLYLSYPFKTYVHRRTFNTLERMRDQVDRVIITFIDSNAPLGEKDKQCKVRLTVSGLPDIMAASKQEHLYDAFSKALATANHTLNKKLANQHSHRDCLLLAM